MCGIVGFSGFRDDRSLEAMMNAIAYRGPDDSGRYCSARVSMGHRRLKIIDMSQRGRQPMANEDGSIRVVYNGEIYNHEHLRKELMERGHIFRSQSDTEVILHQYEEDGPGCVERFNGMFAFALWDENRGVLLLARDRLGIKPLYYYWDGSVFLFASEIKALIQCARVKKELYMESVFELLMIRYNMCEQTVIKNIFKVCPGHYLVFRDMAIAQVKRYWKIPAERIDCTLEDAQGHFIYLLKRSVRSHLVADVPVGIMLSGGIDSSAICALAAETGGRINTFSLGFQGQPDNEFSHASLVARMFNTNHREIMVSGEAIRFLPEVIWYNDEPVGGPSSVAYYMGLKEARRDCTVMLVGHGADEILAGYEELKIQTLARQILRPPINYMLYALVSVISGLVPSDTAFARLRDYMACAANQELHFLKLICVMDNRELSKYLMAHVQGYNEAFNKLLHRINGSFRYAGGALCEGIINFEMEGWLCEDILLRVDRMTMARSIEARVPFLDHEVVEFVLSLPMSLRLRLWQDKYILRRAMRGRLPRQILDRTKQRFNTPIHSFFSERYDAICKRIFSENNFLNQTIFDTKSLLTLLQYKKHLSYRALLRHNKLAAQFYARQIWNILVFQMWYKMFFENVSPQSLI